eukprot:868205-Amphidinium_carterae.1
MHRKTSTRPAQGRHGPQLQQVLHPTTMRNARWTGTLVMDARPSALGDDQHPQDACTAMQMEFIPTTSMLSIPRQNLARGRTRVPSVSLPHSGHALVKAHYAFGDTKTNCAGKECLSCGCQG